MKAAITAIGGYVPEYVLTNDELANIVETNDEWITTRTGIKERRILKPEEGMGASYLAIKAVEAMKAEYGVRVDDVDLVILASVTPDMPVAIPALILHKKLVPQTHTHSTYKPPVHHSYMPSVMRQHISNQVNTKRYWS